MTRIEFVNHLSTKRGECDFCQHEVLSLAVLEDHTGEWFICWECTKKNRVARETLEEYL